MTNMPNAVRAGSGAALKMQTIAKMLILPCAALLFSGTARANLVTNGSFESPVVPAGSFTNFTVGTSTLTGWTVVGPTSQQVSIVSTTFSQGGVAFEAEDGSQWLDLTGDGSNSTEGVQQSVATTVGTNYDLTFYIGNTTGGGIFGTTSTVGLDINGSQVSSFTNSTADTTGLSWEQFSYDFTATGTSTSIGFVNLDPGSDNSNGLDNVDLELGGNSGPPPGPAPEPSSLVLLGTGLAGFAGMAGNRIGRLLGANRSRS